MKESALYRLTRDDVVTITLALADRKKDLLRLLDKNPRSEDATPLREMLEETRSAMDAIEAPKRIDG